MSYRSYSGVFAESQYISLLTKLMRWNPNSSLFYAGALLYGIFLMGPYPIGNISRWDPVGVPHF